MKALKQLWGLVQVPARMRFLLLLLMVSLGGFVELIGILTTAEFMSLVATPEGGGGLRIFSHLPSFSDLVSPDERLMTGFLLAVFILGFVHIYAALKSVLRARFVWLQDKEIATRLFASTLSRSYSWFLGYNSAQLHRLILSGHITQRLLASLVSSVGYLAVASTLIVALIVQSPTLALIGFSGLTLAYGLVRLFSRKMIAGKGKQAHQADEEKRVIAQEALGSLRFVKLSGREGYFVERFAERAEAASKGMIFPDLFFDVVRAFLEWVAFVGILGLSLYLVSTRDDSSELVPTLTFYAMAFYRIIPAVHQLFSLWSRLKFDLPYLNQIEELLEEAPDCDENLVYAEPVNLEGSAKLIDIKQVTFQYSEDSGRILKNLELSIGLGEWIGLVGSTGSGKSTLLDLCSGLISPTTGEIKVGQTVLNEANIRSWQSHIAVVPQEVILLDDSLARNVAFGVEADDVDEDQVLEVCELAGLSDFLLRLPGGLETKLGERGSRLSGGERQRVGIARALYRNPSLLLLDEATSALDRATEVKIVETLRELAGRCTVVTVAHRLSTLRYCDRILVLKDGKIASAGKFEELLRADACFQDLAIEAQS